MIRDCFLAIVVYCVIFHQVFGEDYAFDFLGIEARKSFCETNSPDDGFLMVGPEKIDDALLSGMLFRAELACADGNTNQVRNTVRMVAQYLVDLKDRFRRGHFIVCYAASRVEYALIRMMQDNRQLGIVTPDLIMKTIPDGLFCKASDYRISGRIQSYRNLMVIGAAIEAWRNEHGKLPASLEDVSMQKMCDAWGNKAVYSVSGDEWQLYYPGPENENLNRPFDVYIPSIIQHGLIRSRGIWLSSTFSGKRRDIYKNGVLYSGTRYRFKREKFHIVWGE